MYKYENTYDVIYITGITDTYYTSSTHTFPYWPYMFLVTELTGSSLTAKRQVM